MGMPTAFCGRSRRSGAGVGNGLYAYAAGNLATELYNSNQAANGRDKITYAKFAPPTVVNGMVYVATPTGVAAFGLLPQ